MRVLVTGVGSDIGLNCGRLLKTLGWVSAVHGIDIHDDHPAACVLDMCAVAPRADAPDYADWLAAYVACERIDVVIPSSEAEIARIAADDRPLPGGARLLMADRRTVETALDKHRCLTFLKDNGIAVPAHGLVGTDVPSGWPVVVKPRRGQGSKGLSVAQTAEQFSLSAAVGAVWQAQLLPADQEYTCAVYRTPAVGTRILLLRRTLQGGLTGKGEVVENEAIRSYVEAIARVLDVTGSINVQLRHTAGGPLLFEINPRLSSTVYFRHLLGFRDLEWWLGELAGRPVPDYSPAARGTRFYRGSQEYIVRA